MKWILILLLLIPVDVAAQAWSGILSTNRATDWTTAGTAIQTRTVNCATESPGVSVSQINSDIQNCPAGQVIFLNAGTYNLAGGIIMKSGVTLRGAGANQTFLVFSTDTPCDGQGADICVMGENTYFGSSWILPGGSQAATWSGGYSQGTTSITLTGIGAVPPVVGQYIYLDQSNVNADNGNYFVCDNTTLPCSLEGGAPGRTIGGNQYNQVQVVKVTNISGSTFTITPGLRAINWSGTLTPGAWWAAANMTGWGIENLSLDHTGSSELFGIEVFNAFEGWISGIRSIKANRNHILLSQAAHVTVQNSYFYGTKNSGVTSYGVESTLSSDNLVVNCIFQQVTAPIILGTAIGSVFAYNYTIDDFNNNVNFLQQAFAMGHDAGAQYNLMEGNSTTGFWGDVFHGSSGLETMFRNHATGWEQGKSEVQIPVQLESYNRVDNVIGNILGQPSYQTTYQTQLGPGGLLSIYDLGAGNTEGAVTVPNDSVVASSLMRWGNYDTFNAAVRFVSSEVPTGFTTYSNSVPGSHTLPASFYYSSTPSWWPAGKAWPPIGPDVTTDNVGTCTGTYAGNRATAAGQCSGGTLSTAWASQVVSIPAEDCYLASMSGPPDGSGSVLNFNPSTCYSVATAKPPSPVLLVGTNTSIKSSWTISGTPCGTSDCISNYTETFTPPQAQSVDVVTVPGNVTTYTYAPGGNLVCGTWNVSLVANWLDYSGSPVASTPATGSISEPCPTFVANPPTGFTLAVI